MNTDPRDVLVKFDPDEAIRLLDSLPATAPYHIVPDTLSDLWRKLEREFGSPGFRAFQCATMTRLMEGFAARATVRRYSQSILDRFEISFRRIRSGMQDENYLPYSSETDLLLKDLAICRQRLFPAGARLVEDNRGFARSLALRGGPAQAIAVVRALLEAGGNFPFYEVHTHMSELEDFNLPGWIRSCIRIAEMLELNPQGKGMIGGSWYNDPARARISPNLAYLTEGPAQNGAYLLFSEVNHRTGALHKSKTRQALFEQGKYVPKTYVFVWRRKPLIAWARQVAAVESGAR